MEFRMLGRVELWAGGKPCKLGSRKERGVLAVLLWELGRPVSVEDLASRVWGEEALGGAFESLYQNVSRLRKRLRDAGGTGRELPRRSGFYLLDVRPQDVDAWRFRSLRDAGRAAATSGDDERAVTLYEEAAALWRGNPLDGIDGDWAESIRARLNEEWLSAATHRVKAGLRLGRHAELIGEIADLVRQHPLDESLLDLQLRALYGAGRQAEALSTYLEAELRWRKETGGNLSSALRDLHQLMLHDDPTLRATPPAHRVTVPSSTPPRTISPCTIPRDNPDFTGRSAELSALSSWLGSVQAQSTVPVAVISGMPGVGKSALAVHAAHSLLQRYPAAQLYLRLHGHDADGEPTQPAAALGSLLRMLGVPDTVIPADEEGRAALWRAMLTNRKALIVLDDALTADQVLPLLPGTPGSLVLITTRRRTLSLPGMLPLPLAPMPPADAASLFTRTAGASAGAAADQPAVSRVVRLCGHVPLEIRLAGRRLRGHPAWSVRDLAARLGDMRSGDRDMTAALALSYRYLTASQQRLFRWLALHPGDSFSAHAAAAMAGEAPAVTEQTLEVLFDFYLIEEPVSGRYTFHDLIRGYAAGLAEADPAPDRRPAMRRLLDYYVCLASHADRIAHPFNRQIPVPQATISSRALPPPGSGGECVARLKTEQASLLGAARYAAANDWPVHAGLLAHLLAGFLDSWGDWADAIRLHRRAVAAWRANGNAAGEATALVDLAFILCRTGQHAEAGECTRAALAVARAAADSGSEAAALDTQGIILSVSGRYAEALACHDQAISRWRDLGERHGTADALSRSVLPAARLANHQDALRRAELARAAYRELGDPQGESNALNNLGGLYQDARDYDEALGSYQRAMAAFRQLGDRQGEAIAVSNIGDIRRLTGHQDEAVRAYRTALGIFRDIGDRGSQAAALNGLAAAFAATGDHPAALDHYKHALVLASELADRHAQAVSHLGIGAVHLALGWSHSAADDYRIALRLSRQVADPAQEGQALHGLGCALLETEGAAAAREQWRAALAIFAAMDSPEAGIIRARLEGSAA